ncbi:MAG TPA: type III pantothenate kinase, partial [Deltaproteobacteria bacterium]|nr:type III pantothenate kinase [Deltaproteobacteria bacterium]
FAGQSHAVLVSVRPDAASIVERDLAAAGTETTRVTVDTPMGIGVAYETPETLGADRLVCAAAAYSLYSDGTHPVVVADMGTATTIDYVTASGVFTGGMIAPGITSAYEGLMAAAPRLPRIELGPDAPTRGTSTSSCLLAGTVTSHAAMIMKAAEMMGKEDGKTPVVVITGGLSVLVRRIMPDSYIFDDNLILRGLRLIHAIIHAGGCKVGRPSRPIHA